MKNSRAIYLLLLANCISSISQGITMLAVPWYFTGIIHRGELFGQAYFAITCVSLLWGVYAGTLVDRYSRKNIFLFINMMGLLVITTISAYGFALGSLPWLLVISVFATTMFIYNIHFPNLYAFAHEITEKANYGRVTSLLEIQGQVAYVFSGALAAILLNGFNQHVSLFGMNITLPFSTKPWQVYEIFALDAFTYLVAFIIIYRIKSLPVIEKQVDTSRLRERIRSGFGFLRRHPLLLHFGNASLFVFITILIFGTYVQPLFVDQFLHRGGDVYAISDMAFALGALLAGFLTTKLFAEKHTVLGIILLSIVAGLMYFLMSVSTIVPLFFAANFVIGICNAAIRIQRVTYIFHHVPNNVIGRTNSVLFVISVSFRLCLIAVCTIPFFHRGTNVVYATMGMGLVCFAGALILAANYRRLMNEPVVA